MGAIKSETSDICSDNALLSAADCGERKKLTLVSAGSSKSSAASAGQGLVDS